MVYWFLSSFVSASLQVLIEKLANLGISVYESVSNVEDKLKKLERTLFKVQAMIQYAEDKQISQLAWQVWLRDLEQVAYDADDLIDEVAIEVSKLENGNHNYKEQVCELLLSLFKRSSTFNMNHIQVKLDGMIREIDGLCLRELVRREQFDMMERKLQTSSLVNESHVFGREDDKKELIRMLLAPEESCMGKDVPVVTISGMVGIGKTTLAQIVYNYSYHKMEGSFQLRMWVSVTKDFNAARVTKSIIEAATGTTRDVLDLDPLQVQLRQILQGKKFLLVLDDVWTENRAEWDLLLKPLRHGLQGSKIIVTTRSQVVSSMVSTAGSYRLKCLSNEDCWSLLKHEALGYTSLDVCPKLEAIGMEIAKRCRGLPLAAKCLGRSLLHSKMDEDDWILVQKSKIWDLPEVKNEMVPALRLSYHYLPSHLKQCFAYCSLFTPSHEFEKEKLVQMWIGEGFIQPEAGKRMEDTGSYYFDQLLWISFFQREREKYTMHDAVLHLAQSISGDKFYKMEENGNLHTSCLSKSTRHLSVHHTVNFEAFYKCKGLHTFLVSCKYGSSLKEVPSTLFEKLGLLRVLDLSQSQIKELSENINKLKHLRFLDLSETLLIQLPETTHELCSLQTLRLKKCSKLLQLPEGIKMLTSLQHLELEGNIRLMSMPSGIGRLAGLQTLSEFITGSKSGQITELKEMNNIRGSLCIRKLEMVNSAEEAEKAKLVNKIYLESLELQWSNGATVDIQHQERVLNNLKPHETLKELTLRKYGGKIFPSWVSNPSFSKLTNICLYDCENCIFLPSLGILPKLKCLKIVEMHELKNVDSIFSSSNGVNMGFPSLETLEIRDMPKLKGWSGLRENDMQCLLELTIVKCPEMTALPSLRILPKLKCLKIAEMHELNNVDSIFSSSNGVNMGFPSLETLEIRDMRKLKGWSGLRENDMQCLLELTIVKCPEMTALPSLRILPKLKCLKIAEMDKLDNVDSIFSSNGVNMGFPLLKTLEIRDMPNLKSWSGLRGNDMQCLLELTIVKCPEMTALPSLGILPKLKCLKIAEMDKLDNVDSIFSANGVNMGFPLLEKLEIRDMPKLKSWSGLLENDMQCLLELTIVKCPEMISLPSLGILPKLKCLRIAEMHKLDNVDSISSSNGVNMGFPLLETLEIRDMPKLKSWCGLRENDMQCLLELIIVNCPEMNALPSLHYLISLEKLTFDNCPLISSLSNERLPKSTQTLIITSCAKLKEKYGAEGCDDWEKIRHIPNKKIN